MAMNHTHEASSDAGEPTPVHKDAIPVNPGILAVGCVAALLVSISISAGLGAVSVPSSTVVGILANKVVPGLVEQTWSQGREAIVWEIRLPRILLACLVGAGLSLVGAALQPVTRNSLADPHLLGISSGGAFGAILAIMHTGMFLGPATVPAMAFAGSLCATAMVLGLSSFAGASRAERLVLIGVAVSFVLMACANISIFLGDPRASHTVLFWMLGGLGLAEWGRLPMPLAALAVCGAYFWFKSQDFNAVTIGDESASTLGIPVARFRLEVFVVSALLTGVMVAYSGMIGFVGLMVPHIVRMIVGGNNARVIPCAALVGALLLVWCDAVSRTLMAPEVIPIGVVTGLAGGTFFIWLLRKRNAQL